MHFICMAKQAKKTAETEVEQENSVTPMMQQYSEVKARYPDHLLFYRMGDFFELFFEDAIKASKALDIILTRRGKGGNEVPMCGVPQHACESYLNRLIRQGFRVAICDQMETPEEAKKRGGYKAVVRRDVVRVVTPGTLTEDALLEAGASNFLLAVNPNGNDVGLSWCDISTGEIYYTTVGSANLASELERIAPSEIIINEEMLGMREHSDLIAHYRKIVSSHPKVMFDKSRAGRKVKQVFNVAGLEAFGQIDETPLGAMGALLEYVEMTQVDKLPRFTAPRKSGESRFLEIDAASFTNLEIFTAGGDSLFGTLNRNCTNAGARALRKVMARPLADKVAIENRLDAVEFLMNNQQLLEDARGTLRSVPDMERIISRIYLNRSNPRDIAVLREGLKALMQLLQIFSFNAQVKLPNELKELMAGIGNFDSLIKLLDEAVVEFPPIALNEGGFVKSGFNARLDDYRNTRQNSERIKTELQDRYVKETGISGLKIKDNNVIGMFVEITPMHMEKVPDYFVHRQTLANNVRYTTPELRQVEGEIINSASYAINLELEIYKQLGDEIKLQSDAIVTAATSAAMLDVLACFAFLAANNNYTRPQITTGTEFIAEEGRHPVVENAVRKLEDRKDFIANDLSLAEKNRLWLLTGPNMSGKSTFLRQNALMAIMAQMGCFVPAKSMKLGVMDKIFSRVGASDNIAKGHSTFMVEMVETAAILNNATAKSFVILDEIGRGTATFDGLAIAWATLEHIHDNIRCRCLFATHYHELNSLEGKLSAMECRTTSVKEWNGEIIFMHKVTAGKANRSYGVHVAKLAGIPRSVVGRADEILEILVQQNKGNSTEILADSLPLFGAAKAEFNQNESEALNQIRALEPDNMSPIQALNELIALRKNLQS